MGVDSIGGDCLLEDRLEFVGRVGMELSRGWVDLDVRWFCSCVLLLLGIGISCFGLFGNQVAV